LPLKPALQRHPLGTLAPSEFAGQATASQVLMKNGAVVVALTMPLKPALQKQPVGTSTPPELAGQATAVQVLL